MSIYIHEDSEKTEEWGIKSLLEKEMWWGKHVVRARIMPLLEQITGQGMQPLKAEEAKNQIQPLILQKE